MTFDHLPRHCEDSVKNILSLSCLKRMASWRTSENITKILPRSKLEAVSTEIKLRFNGNVVEKNTSYQIQGSQESVRLKGNNQEVPTTVGAC